MAGITSLRIEYYLVSPLSINALFRRENGDLPLPDLRDLTVLGPYEIKMMASVEKLVTERKGSIITLNVPSTLEQDDIERWKSLQSFVPNLRVRIHNFLRNDHIVIEIP